MPQVDCPIRTKFENKLLKVQKLQYSKPRLALEIAEEAVTIARSNLEKADIASALNTLARTFYRVSEFEKSLAIVQEALALLDKVEISFTLASTIRLVGMIKTKQGVFPEALESLEEALELFESLNDKNEIGNSLCSIGSLYYDWGLPERALDFFVQSELSFESDKDVARACSGMNAANVLQGNCRFEEAIERYRNCIKIFEETENLYNLRICLYNLSNCTIELNRIEETQDISNECMRVSKLLGDRGAIAKSLLLEGRVLNVLGDHHAALHSSMCALKELESINDFHGTIQTLLFIAQIHSDQNNNSEAELLLARAETLAGDNDLKLWRSGICFDLACVLEKQNRFKEALEYYKAANKAEKEVLEEKQHNRITALSVIHEVERAKNKAEIYQLRNVELKQNKADLEDIVAERTVELQRQIQECRRADKEKAEIEAHLIRSQRLSDLARLTGGITHDFNNLLTVVLAYAELSQFEEDSKVRQEYLDKIIHAGHLGSELANQLLSFCRMQPRVLSNFDIAEVLTSTHSLLDRLTTKSVSVRLNVQPDVGRLFGDKTMISQVIINLCINSGDAMPEGGLIQIEASKVHGSDGSSTDSVVIKVSDQGTGMHPEVVEKIFNPYFTTKELGKGTGLGLSVVHGIVEQHGGRIEVESEVGVGTTFSIYLPLSQGEKDSVELHEEYVGSLEGHGEHLLIVEDQEEILVLLKEVLGNSGYIVSSASSLEEAIKLHSAPGAVFDLSFIDLILPDGSGIELSKKFREINPDQRILFGSGFARKPEDIEFIERYNYRLVQKPYNISELKCEIRKALE